MELSDNLTAALYLCAEDLYVIDEETRTMLYASPSLQAQKGRDYAGVPCYKYLCGKDAACAFCPKLLPGDPVYSWEYYEADKNNCKLVKNLLVEDGGRLFRVGNANLIQSIIGLSRDTAGEVRALHEVIAQNEQRKYALEWGAFHDRMTRLYNRARYMKDCADLYAEGMQTALAYFDINDLKSVNDLLGHQEGDRMILAVSGILELTMSPSVHVYRMGGDEFLAVLVGGNEETVGAYIANFYRELGEYNRRFGKNYVVAVGSFCGALGADGMEAVFKLADDRMYADKKQRKLTAAQQ